MIEYRCTRSDRYKGTEEGIPFSSRQGHYILADTEKDAKDIMAKSFQGETSFTADLFKIDNKRVMKVKTWCPIFTGFYNSIFESDDYLVEELVEDLLGKELSEDYDYSQHFDEMAFRKARSEEITEVIGEELESLGLISKCEFEQLISPKYYNRVNDSINVTYYMTRDNLLKLKEYMSDNYEEFESRIYEANSSRPGFIPFHSSDIADWKEGISTFEELPDNEFNIGFLFNLILEEIEGLDVEWLYSSLEVSESSFIRRRQ
ncbi:MAG: hypothetical protein U9N34_03730 [Candidatus Cloacimonadota bacterium]|nr:hypothetical protein [Candidatus Cloacimonadota bacterium]